MSIADFIRWEWKTRPNVLIQIEFIPIPFLYRGLDFLVDLLNKRRGLINAVSMRYGHEFVSATPPSPSAPCKTTRPCVNLWFYRKGSPILPLIPAIIGALASLVVIAGIIIVAVRYFEYKIEEQKAIQVTEHTQNVREMYEQCLKVARDPQVCNQIIEGVKPPEKPPELPTLTGIVSSVAGLMILAFAFIILREAVRK